MSALVMAGLVAGGSAAHLGGPSTPPKAPGARHAEAGDSARAADGKTDEAKLAQTLGMLPVEPEPPRKLRALRPAPADAIPPFAGTVPLNTLNLPRMGGALGIPEIVLAAYRNAELAMQSTMPGCGLSWSLLAGIGRIESGHANNGRTDAAGTATPPIFGPALDGTLPGNEIIRAPDGSYVRAVGPMQFLPETWARYQADGNADGHADPHNVFDAALAAGKYLCSGGLDLRDPQQELRAVLRYNNSMSYAANVLSWSMAYRTGGGPSTVPIVPDLVPPGSSPTYIGPGTDMTAVDTRTATTNEAPPPIPPVVPTTPQEPMIRIPGLPPIPCGVFCPPAPGAPNAEPDVAPALPGAPATPPGNPPEQAAPPAIPPTPEDPRAATPPAPAPVLTLPFGIVVPLPQAPIAPQVQAPAGSPAPDDPQAPAGPPAPDDPQVTPPPA
ncbi:lytic transglycosylase domain-containing protein [Nocardia paucivorans]|uniref:lytic transglycosylase domain-containing protein n=1 Tax=Nocardia paucivorans TaxID=114259 RepID=UPI001FDF9BED|nr:lytic murein transglycosylase [Nocardia paucivorans]